MDPTVMLAVIGLPLDVVRGIVAKINKAVATEASLHIGLINSSRQVVISGAPNLLELVRKQMGDRRISPGDNQPRVPFSKRQLNFRSVFLPMSVPFHSPVLKHIVPMIIESCSELNLGFGDDVSFKLNIPVLSTANGLPLSSTSGSALIEELVSLIVMKSMDWVAITDK